MREPPRPWRLRALRLITVYKNFCERLFRGSQELVSNGFAGFTGQAAGARADSIRALRARGREDIRTLAPLALNGHYLNVDLLNAESPIIVAGEESPVSSVVTQPSVAKPTL